MGPFLIGLRKNIYLRGVISAGEFYQSTKMVIGPAIDDAAAHYTSPNWIGVSATPSLSTLLSPSHAISGVIVQYKIPHKEGIEENGWALAWPYYAKQHGESYYRQVLSSECLIHRHHTEYQKYYYNTLRFYDFLTQQ